MKSFHGVSSYGVKSGVVCTAEMAIMHSQLRQHAAWQWAAQCSGASTFHTQMAIMYCESALELAIFVQRAVDPESCYMNSNKKAWDWYFKYIQSRLW